MKFLTVFFLLSFILNSAQEAGFTFKDSRKKESVPFQLINNLIFIPVTVNGVQLTFLLDSGVSETIIFSFDDKEISFADAKKTVFRGLGGQADTEGYEAAGNRMEIGRHLADTNQKLFLIFDPEFNISSHVGIPVNGVIGYQLFKNLKVNINYISKKITFFAPDEELKLKGYDSFDLSLELNKPYLQTSFTHDQQEQPAKMLLDIGNSDAVWIFPGVLQNPISRISLTDEYLGRGFNGDVFGTHSRIDRIDIGKFKFEKPIIAVPESGSIQNVRLAKDRKGSVGDEILRRFHIFMDYPGGKIYLKPNGNYRDPFNVDMSGLYIRHNGMQWEKDLVTTAIPFSGAVAETPVISSSGEFHYRFSLKPEYVIGGVRKGSPAAKAGLMSGDKILSINGKPGADYKLHKISELLKTNPGKKIKMVVDRQGRSYTFEFILEDPIPH